MNLPIILPKEVIPAYAEAPAGRRATVEEMEVAFPVEGAVWLPNLIFGAVGVWLYRTAPK